MTAPLLTVCLLLHPLPHPAALQAGARAPSFERLTLATEFLCEGASFADLDRDGKMDVVSGPYWYRGPDFATKREIYPPKGFDPAGYSDNFFAFPRDFDGDGWTDVLFVGFPGEAATWYTNPRGKDEHWAAHVVLEHVDGESPEWADLTGDGVPELVFLNGGKLGWAGPERGAPEKPWVFHPLSEDLSAQRFTHGLGVGDVDGDKRADVLLKDGWWQQPSSLAGDPVWTLHPFVFTPKHGGAQMLVTDVDGDGDNDVITSLAAHEFGLVWWEAKKHDGALDFVEHVVMGEKPEDNAEGVKFGELHALALADVDGDGLADIVTGKRWWSHGAKGDPDGGAVPAVTYAFLLRREKGGAHYVARLLDDDSGVGTQVVAADVSGDGKVDVVIGNKKGTFVLRQKGGQAPPAPQRGVRPADRSGRVLNLDLERGDLADWTATGDAFADQPVKGDAPRARGREPALAQGECWIGGFEPHGDERTGTLTSAPFVVSEPWASFLLGGGGGDGERLELLRLEEGREPAVVFRTSAANFETLQRVVIDLGAERGHELAVRLVDEETGGWGHLNFDDLLLHATRPSFPPPPGTPPIMPADVVQHAGLAPEEAVRAMTLPEGFRVERVASEPELHQPITIDARGRLWVVEAFTYPQRAPEGQGKDDILVFEDADHDGSFEKRTVFATGLNLVSGLEVGFGGAWVGAAPYLLFIPDKNDDLVPDGPPEVLLDGWGYQDTHETLNGFAWGPDGWLYGCHGVFTHSKVGKPGASDAERTPLNAGVWRYHPLRHEFEVFAWGTSNPWGVDFDAHGQCFVTACVIPHLYHLTQGGRYLRQAGAHFDPYVFEDIGTIADHLHWQGADPWSGNLRSNAVGGGHAHCGALIYQDDAFPPDWRGRILMNNIHGNRTNADMLVRAGSGYVGKHSSDLLVANDKWFRGIALELSPEGSVYVSDWYDKQACHWTEPGRWDRTNGRIYRVSYGAHQPLKVDLPALPSSELVRLLFHPNEWFARRARVLLEERGPAPEVAATLRRILLEKGAVERDERALRALWALHSIGGIDEDLGHELFSSSDEYVRAWTVQCLLERRAASSTLLDQLALLAIKDSSPVVRLYLAAGLQRIPVESRFGLARALVAHGEDAADINVPLLLWYGIEPLVAAQPEQALVLARESKLEKLTRFVYRRAASEPALGATLVQTVASEREPARRTLVLDEWVNGVRDARGLNAPQGWPALFASLSADADAHVRDQALELAIAFGDASAFPALRATVADPKAEAGRRARALDALVRSRAAGALEVLLSVLDDAGLRAASIRGLAAFDAPEVAPALLSHFASFDAGARRDAVATLAARASTARALLEAVGDGRVAKNELTAFQLRALRALGDPELDGLLDRHIGQVRPPDASKDALFTRMRAVLDAGGERDLAHGREVFSRTCQQCHTLFGTGGNLGPELTGANRTDREYLLSNVLEPSGVVANEYRTTVARLADGRLVTGIERARSASSVTLQSERETLVLALTEIDELELSPLSTMPEGQLEPMAPDEVRDLFAYLASPAQTPLRATPLNASGFFDGKTLANWHGDPAVWSVDPGPGTNAGEIVGRSAGLEKNAFLVSAYELGDFRLSLELRLVGDQGNSGVQFRTHELEGGEVKGYQADVGPGWWGKLYEENGRALLVDKGASRVVLDGWNRYVIECRGSRVRTWLNDEACVDLDDPSGARKGQVALQLHSGGATEVRFRALKVELLQ